MESPITYISQTLEAFSRTSPKFLSDSLKHRNRGKYHFRVYFSIILSWQSLKKKPFLDQPLSLHVPLLEPLFLLLRGTRGGLIIFQYGRSSYKCLQKQLIGCYSSILKRGISVKNKQFSESNRTISRK